MTDNEKYVSEQLTDPETKEIVIVGDEGRVFTKDNLHPLGHGIFLGDGGPTQREKTNNDRKKEEVEARIARSKLIDRRWRRLTQVFEILAAFAVVRMLFIVIAMKEKSDARDEQYLKNVQTYELLRENSIKGLDMHGVELKNQTSGLNRLRYLDSVQALDHRILLKLAEKSHLDLSTVVDHKPK